MKLIAILAVTVAIVTATTIPPKTTLEPEASTESETVSYVEASASVGDVEVPAVVQEVDGDWLYQDGLPPTPVDDTDDGDEDEESDIEDEDIEYGHLEDDGEEEDDEDYEEDLYDEREEDETDISYDYDDDDYDDAGTQDEFEANVPSAIHGTKDVIIHKDNFIPILKTIVLAYTHKAKPSYSEILKASGISAFKTGFKYFGKENLGASLLKLAKKLTGAFEDEPSDDLKEEILAELAEEYLSSHRFKLVLPESVLLHQEEMEEFLDKTEIDEIEGRSFMSNKQFDIAMPRADPAVHTVLTIGPMTWMALLGGLFSIPYFFSGSEEPARVDHVTPDLYPYLRPPGLPFFSTHQLRRDEQEQERIPHQQIDQEYLEYQQSYAQWYNQWYLKYKNYYDEHYPNHQQPHPPVQHQQQPQPPVQHQQQPPPPVQLHQQPPPPVQHHQQPPPPVLHQVQQHQQSPVALLDVMTPPPPVGEGLAKVPPQKPLHPPQKPLPPKQQLPKQPPPIQFNRPLRPQVLPVAPAERPRLDSGRNAGANILSNAGENKANTFGTFQSEDNKGDSHFRVIQGSDTVAQTTTSPRAHPKVPSPQPVYIPTTGAPQTESGFKPITKPNSSTVKPNTTPSPKTKDEFRPPKEETLVTAESQGKTKTPVTPEAASKTRGGFKPIPPPSEATETNKKPETSTIKISPVTSGIFKTSTRPTPPTTTTSRPAVFVRTATQKSVRVVTSSSVVVPNITSHVSFGGVQHSLPDLKRPQRHQQDVPSDLQQISNQVKTQQSPPVHQPLPLQPHSQPQQQRPVVSQTRPEVPQARPAVPQTRPEVPQARPAVPQANPAVQQARPEVPQARPLVPQAVLQTRPEVPQVRPAVLLQQQQQHQQQQLQLQQQQQQLQQQGPTIQQLRPVQPQLTLQQQQPSAGLLQAQGVNTGFVRTNVPTVVRVVEHQPGQDLSVGTEPRNDATTTTTTTTPMPIYALDPFYGSRLSRVDVIFHQLGVESEGCREQAVCNIYKNPDVYTPYSDFLSRQLTVTLEELQKPKVSDERILRFFRYLKAAREGQDGSDCLSKYPDCPYDTAQLSHKPIMNAFQKMSLLMKAGSS